MNTTIVRENVIVAMAIMIISTIFFSMNGYFSSMLLKTYTVPFLMVARYVGAALFLWWMVLITSPKGIMPQSWRFIVARACVGVVGFVCFYIALEHGTLLMSVLGFNTGPLWLPIIRSVMERKALRLNVMFAIIVSALGLFIFSWDYNGHVEVHFGLAMIFAIASGFFNACTQYFIHLSSKTDSPFIFNLWVYTISSLLVVVLVLCCMPFISLWQGHVMGVDHALISETFMFIVLSCIATLSVQVLRGYAFRFVGDPSYIAPGLYFSVLFSGIFDVLLGHSIPSIIGMFGIVLICGAGSYLLIISKKNNKVEV